MTTPMLDYIEKLRATLPNLPDEKLVEFAINSFEVTPQVRKKSATVSEVLTLLREERMFAELARDRAAVKSDGTMRLKDTSTFRTYETTWVRLEAKFGGTNVSELKRKDILAIALEAQRSAKTKQENKNQRRIQNGFSPVDATGNAGYNRALSALSTFMEYAVENDYCDKNLTNSVKRLSEQDRKRSKLDAQEIDTLMQVALGGGDDPILDHLFLWTLVETGARVGGLLHLQLQDINMTTQTIALHEKGSKVRHQPVTLELATSLKELAESRGAEHPSDSVFRYGEHSKSANQSMTSRRIDTMWARFRKELPWLEERNISSHSIRRSILTLVERRTSTAVTRAFAGHGQTQVTDGYTEADGNEVARAHQKIFGRKHPLA
jgi:integrase